MQLFQDDEIIVAGHDVEQSAYDFLLITFAYAGLRSDGDFFWGLPLAKGLGINSIGFVARKQNWYPEQSVRAAIKALSPRLARHKHRLTYGSSQGGFAALKYATALQAGTTLAFVPQYSIDPAVVGGFDPRFSQHFRAEHNRGMEITAADVAPQSFVIVDQHHMVDKRNVDMIRDAAPGITIIRMPHTHHRPVITIAGSALASRLFRAAMAGDAQDLGRQTALARRASAHRSYHLFRAAAARHPAWAVGIFRREAARMVADEATNAKTLYHKLLRRLAAQTARGGDFIVAVAWAEAAVAAATDEASRVLAQSDLAAFLLRKGQASGQAEDVTSAIAAARAALVTAPSHRPALRVLATALGVAGAFAEAAATMRHVLALDPADPSGQHALALYLIHNRDRPGAIAAARAAVAQMPDNLAFQKRLAGAEAMRP